VPANLPPQYLEAEKRFRGARTPEDKLEALEEMIAVVPKHKGTDKLRADLRRRVSKLKDQTQKKKGGARQKTAYTIDKEGAAQIAVIGPPNTGKSSLVALMTKASPEIADFPHSTHKPTPGMAVYENIQFQLVDTPPLTKEYVDSDLVDFIRRTDIILIILDLFADPLQELEDTLHVLAGLRIFPRGAVIPEIPGKRPFIKTTLVVVNKMDLPEDEETYEIFLELTELTLPVVGVSTRTGKNLPALMKAIFDLAEVIRVYTKIPGRKADLEEPYIIPRNSTLEDLAVKIHKDFVTKLKHARIWGTAVRDGQMVQRDYVMQDGDIVELHV